MTGNNSVGIGNKGITSGNRSVNFNLRTTTPVAGAGQDLTNTDRFIPGFVQDDELFSIQGGNVSIGRESDMFNPISQGVGNLFVGGNILYGGEIQQLNPEGGAPISANVFVDGGREITMLTPRNIGIGKIDANAALSVRGDIQVDGSLANFYGPSATDSAIFDSAGGPAGTLYNSMFLYYHLII